MSAKVKLCCRCHARPRSSSTQSYCAECRREWAKEWKARNPHYHDQWRAAHKHYQDMWKARNPNYHDAWKAAHPGYFAKWRQDHPELIAEYRRRAKQKPNYASGAEWDFAKCADLLAALNVMELHAGRITYHGKEADR